jgi:hypothetical protein
LAEKIKKGQFKTGKLGGAEATMLELWNAALLPAGLSRRYPSTVAYPASTLRAILASVRDCFRTRAALQMEVPALRHQLNVLERSVK